MAEDTSPAPKPAFVERRQKWSFFVLADGSWVWRVLYPDGTDRSAEVGFRTLDECTADAARHGYVRWPAERERRRSQQ